MKSTKQVGIWMDHSTANILKLSNDKIATITLELTPAFPEQVQNLRMDESLIHNKEQNKQADFYKKLSNHINGTKKFFCLVQQTQKQNYLTC